MTAAFTPWGLAPLAAETFGPLHLYEPANDNSPRVIGLSGVAGSGKSTAASYLQQRGYQLVKFAGPLKDMCRAIGMTESQIEGDHKERPSALLQGKTPRQAMQWLGTQWGRDLIGRHFWIGLWEARVNAVLDEGGCVVTDDCRFPNEADAIRKLGGVVIRLQGRGGIAGGHSSESLDWEPDEVIDNTGDRHKLYEELARVAA